MSENIEYQDFHLHTNSVEQLKNFILRLGFESKNKNSNPIISFPQHEYILNIDNISLLSRRLGIKLIPSFSTFSDDKNEFIILYPNDNAKKFCRKLSIERADWILTIVENLKQFNRLIDIKRLISRLHKKPNELELLDICVELCDPYYKFGDCVNPTIVYNKYIKGLKELFPRIRPTVSEIIHNCSGCPIYTSTPNDKLINHSGISGIIFNKNTSDELLIKAKINNKNVLYGSGNWL